MNNENQSRKPKHTTLEIESLSKPINRKKIIRYSREFNCDPKHIMLFKREYHPLISSHELISCHFIEDESLDRHLDRLDIGFRNTTEGHSKWVFPRNSQTIKNQKIGLPELYFTENFAHFFKYVVDVDTEAVFTIDEFTTQRREDLMYNPPLKTNQLVYVSDILKTTKQHHQGVEKPILQLINGSGYLDDYVELINSENDTHLFRGIYETNKPHLLLILATKSDKGTIQYLKFILLDTKTLRVIDVYSNSYQPDRRNFLLVCGAEDEDFRKQNDIIAE